MKVDMSLRAVTERLKMMDELWLLSVKLMNSTKKKYKSGELARYLLNYCPELLTSEEKAAYKNTLVLKKIENAESPGMKKMLHEQWFSSDEKILKLLKDGEAEFFKRLEQRVLRDNPDQSFMNLCPKCGYLTKTPKAKQCWKCIHSWYEEDKK